MKKNNNSEPTGLFSLEDLKKHELYIALVTIKGSDTIWEKMIFESFEKAEAFKAKMEENNYYQVFITNSYK